MSEPGDATFAADAGVYYVDRVRPPKGLSLPAFGFTIIIIRSIIILWMYVCEPGQNILLFRVLGTAWSERYCSIWRYHKPRDGCERPSTTDRSTNK